MEEQEESRRSGKIAGGRGRKKGVEGQDPGCTYDTVVVEGVSMDSAPPPHQLGRQSVKELPPARVNHVILIRNCSTRVIYLSRCFVFKTRLEN